MLTKSVDRQTLIKISFIFKAYEVLKLISTSNVFSNRLEKTLPNRSLLWQTKKTLSGKTNGFINLIISLNN